MLEDFRLKVFVTVAQTRSFTKAAAQLSISQPAVSQHIAELEKVSGVKLFDRLKGEVVLTGAGEVFLSHALEILSEYRDLNIIFSNVPAMNVTISTSEEIFNYIINDILAPFIKVHPQVTFTLALVSDADLTVNVNPDKEKRGTFALSFSPSESFAATRLYKILTQLL